MTLDAADVQGRCPACGAPSLMPGPVDFCPRCLVRTSLLDPDAPDDDDDAFAHILTRQARGIAPRLGDCERLEELSRGGMGVVFKARQTSLHRVVALKMMLLGGVSGPDALQRFQTEARAAADLDHPNIVRVLDAGQRDGQLFLSMTLVAGRSLADVVRDAIPPAHSALTRNSPNESSMHAAIQGPSVPALSCSCRTIRFLPPRWNLSSLQPLSPPRMARPWTAGIPGGPWNLAWPNCAPATHKPR